MRKLICGVGVNDADYVVRPTVNGKRDMCHFYQTWDNMITRCYSAKEHARSRTYIGCSVCEEWLTFSNFKAWMEKQDYYAKHLDKDLLFVGNKVYSPDTCVFVAAVVNTFTTDSAAIRGEYPLGVNFHKASGKFQAQCCNPITKRHEYLGLFTCQYQAHEAWRKRKHELACQLAELQDDQRVAAALRTRYLPSGLTS